MDVGGVCDGRNSLKGLVLSWRHRVTGRVLHQALDIVEHRSLSRLLLLLDRLVFLAFLLFFLWFSHHFFFVSIHQLFLDRLLNLIKDDREG